MSHGARHGVTATSSLLLHDVNALAPQIINRMAAITQSAYHGVGSCDHFSDIMGSVLCLAKRHSRALVIIFLG